MATAMRSPLSAEDQMSRFAVICACRCPRPRLTPASPTAPPHHSARRRRPSKARGGTASRTGRAHSPR
eukprot:7180756-Pyramimonas_sp.AAC.1